MQIIFHIIFSLVIAEISTKIMHTFFQDVLKLNTFLKTSLRDIFRNVLNYNWKPGGLEGGLYVFLFHLISNSMVVKQILGTRNCVQLNLKMSFVFITNLKRKSNPQTDYLRHL